MEERYWLRHRSLQGIVGPYRLHELRAAIDAQSFPVDSEVLPDADYSEVIARGMDGWLPVTHVLGMPQPNMPPQPQHHRTQPASDQAHERLLQMRRGSAYEKLRNLAGVVALIYIVVSCVLTFIVISNAPSNAVILALGGLALEVLVIIVVAGLVQALLDIADFALRADR